nr:MAG TPA: hypothetical protein [Caudoviricetes sp.]
MPHAQKFADREHGAFLSCFQNGNSWFLLLILSML